MSTFFISDLHFGHRSLIENLRNMSVEECDNLIINNWNKVVHKKDLVYVLGDITMEEHCKIAFYMKQLKGMIYVIGGNHDTRQCCQELNRIGIPVMGAVQYRGYLLTHVPAVAEEVRFFRGNIHGHVHAFSQAPLLPQDKYYNVCCELHNYTPIKFEDLVEDFERKKQIIKIYNEANNIE